MDRIHISPHSQISSTFDLLSVRVRKKFCESASTSRLQKRPQSAHIWCTQLKAVLVIIVCCVVVNYMLKVQV